jgi:hypothetical protein
MPTTCPFCERGGIPLMPARLALSTSDNPMPVVTEPFVFQAPKAGMDNGRFKYVLRTLRTGYLYVYDEVRREWSGYVVTADGYYYYFNPEKEPPKSETVVFSCSQSPVDKALASCITVKHTTALPAGKVFLGFSDVAWTPAVFARYKEAAFRQQAMRWVDIAAWIGNHAQNFCAPIDQAETVLSEFCLPQTRGADQFVWSPFAFAAKGIVGADGKPVAFMKAISDAAKTKSAERAKAGLSPIGLQAHHGLIVRIKDPTAVTRETTRLLQHQTAQFMSHPSRVRQVALSNAIAAVKSAVADQSVKDEIAAAEKFANDQVSGNPLGHALFASTRKRTEELRHVSVQEAAKVRSQSWDKYAEKLKPGSLEAFEAKFKEDLAEFDRTWVFTLSDFHSKWMQDSSTQDYFDYNFDAANIANGFAYQALVTLCIEDMADKKSFMDLAAKLLPGDMLDRKNLLLRALVLNNDELARKVTEAANPSMDWRTPGWENVGGWFKEAFAAVDKAAYETWLSGKGPADATSRLFVHMAGPLIRFIAPQLHNPSLTAKAALMAMGITSNAHIVPVDVSGSKDAFRKALVRQLLKSTGQTFTGRQLDKAVADEMRRLEVEGVRAEGQTRQRWLLAVNEKTARQLVSEMPPGLSPTERARRIVSAIQTPEALEAATSRGVLNTVLNMEVRLGVLTAILQGISLSKAMADEDTAMAHETEEVRWKMRAAWMGLVGTITETTMVAVGKMPPLTLRATQGISAARAVLSGASVLKWVGKGAGAAAGIIVAVYDGVHAKEEASQGNWGLAGLYAVSAVTGGVLAVGLLLGFVTGGVAIVLLIVLVALAVLIELFKDNKIQDWLERTLWGIDGDKYESMEVEMKQLESAVAG